MYDLLVIPWNYSSVYLIYNAWYIVVAFLFQYVVIQCVISLVIPVVFPLYNHGIQ